MSDKKPRVLSTYIDEKTGVEVKVFEPEADPYRVNIRGRSHKAGKRIRGKNK